MQRITKNALESFFGTPLRCSCIALLSGIHVTSTILSIHSIHGDMHTAIPGSLCYIIRPWIYAHHHPWLLVLYHPSMDIKMKTVGADQKDDMVFRDFSQMLTGVSLK